MEIKQDEVTRENWDEWNRLKETQACAECGGALDVRTIPERQSLAFGCPQHPDAGYRQRTSYTQDYRRGEDVPLVVQPAIARHTMSSTEFRRAMQLLALRFPDAIRDPAGASLFIHDCLRLGLDPLIQPAEAVPIVFRRKIKDENGRVVKEVPSVAMIVTEDGALSMVARGCPDEYDGAPATMPLLDYLMREHPQRPMEELETMAARTARELCDDERAYVWVALGKRRSADGVQPAYGYFTRAELEDARQKNKPAAKQPGNQARVRAVKRWVRENFPEARQKMLDYTATLNSRSAGAREAQEIIDAEYRFLDIPDKKNTLISRPQGGTGTKKSPKSARTTSSKRADTKVGESAERAPGPGDGRQSNDPALGISVPGGGINKSAAPSGADETTLVLDRDNTFIAPPSEAAAGAGFHIDLDWHNEALKTIRWSWDTARSWLKQKFPSSDCDGTPLEVLSRLTREQADIYTQELQKRGFL